MGKRLLFGQRFSEPYNLTFRRSGNGNIWIDGIPAFDEVDDGVFEVLVDLQDNPERQDGVRGSVAEPFRRGWEFAVRGTSFQNGCGFADHHNVYT